MPERRYKRWIDWPRLRLFVYLRTESGTPAEFNIQVEYDLGHTNCTTDQWLAIARMDHNDHPQKGHNIQQEGLHLDLMDKDNTKHDVKRGFPPVPLDDAPAYAESYLENNAETIAARFEQRNGILGPYRTP